MNTMKKHKFINNNTDCNENILNEIKLKQLLRYALSLEEIDYEIVEFCSNELEKIIPKNSNDKQLVYSKLEEEIKKYNHEKNCRDK